MSPLRRTIAARLVEAQHQAAILTTFNECDMSSVMELRKQFNAAYRERYGTKLGFMSFFIKAVVKALQEVPQVNARIDGTDIVENLYYDISIAIGTDKGLVVPVLRDCDRKRFRSWNWNSLPWRKKHAGETCPCRICKAAASPSPTAEHMGRFFPRPS